MALRRDAADPRAWSAAGRLAVVSTGRRPGGGGGGATTGREMGSGGSPQQREQGCHTELGGTGGKDSWPRAETGRRPQADVRATTRVRAAPGAGTTAAARAPARPAEEAAAAIPRAQTSPVDPFRQRSRQDHDGTCDPVPCFAPAPTRPRRVTSEPFTRFRDERRTRALRRSLGVTDIGRGRRRGLQEGPNGESAVSGSVLSSCRPAGSRRRRTRRCRRTH